METWIEDNGLYVNAVAVRRKADSKLFHPHTCHIYEWEQNDYEVAE